MQEVLYLYLIYTYVQLVFNSFDKLCLISDSKSRYFAAICVLLLMNMYLPTGQGAPLGVWYMQTHIILYFCCDSLTKVELPCTSAIKLNLLEFMYLFVFHFFNLLFQWGKVVYIYGTYNENIMMSATQWCTVCCMIITMFL